MKRSKESDTVDYSIASLLVLLEGTRARIDEIAMRIKEVNRINKIHSKLIVNREAGRNSLTTPIQSGK